MDARRHSSERTFFSFGIRFSAPVRFTGVYFPPLPAFPTIPSLERYGTAESYLHLPVQVIKLDVTDPTAALSEPKPNLLQGDLIGTRGILQPAAAS
jgi:hypothetical protein